MDLYIFNEMTYPSEFLHRILFLDIETVAEVQEYQSLDESVQQLWNQKSRRHISAEEFPFFEEELSALYFEKAGIHAEFAKIVCISVGFLTQSEDESLQLRLKSFSDHKEEDLLTAFGELLNEHYYDRHNQFLCGHNIKEFDIPFICRRMMVLGIKLPNLLNIAGYRPWQTHHLLDTMEMWKYGDYKHYTSLDLLCHALRIPSPKGELSGKDVHAAYYNDKLVEIVKYCEKDVIATVQVYLKCVGRNILKEEDIIIL